MDRTAEKPLEVKRYPFSYLYSEHVMCDAVRNISFSNIHAKSLDDVFIVGRKSTPIKNISFSNCSFVKFLSWEESCFKNNKSEQWQRPDDGNNIAYVENFRLSNTDFRLM